MFVVCKQFRIITMPMLKMKTESVKGILGVPGATSRDDATFSGESLLQELRNQFQKWSNSVPLIGQKNIFLPNQR